VIWLASLSPAFCLAAPPAPWADALVAWRFADGAPALKAVGAVTVGLPLAGEERAASLARGGDGAAARFDGGWLDAGTQLYPQGEHLTILLRLRDPAGTFNCPLLAKHGGHDKLVFNFFSANLGEPLIGFELGTTGTKDMTQVVAPLAMIGPRDWHDLVARYDGAKLSLFVDGVLLDEGFPMGDLRPGNTEPTLLGAESYGGQVKGGFHGLMAHAAIWQRALSDDEITALSGGAEVVAGRTREILGDLPSMQYYKPPNQFNVGDTLPFYHDGVFHFAYLQDRGHHTAKGGYGAHQWAQATSTDLVHWQRQPLMVPIDRPQEGSICTGSLFFWDGTYYAFYATRTVGVGELLSLATSTDGIHFHKTEPNPFLRPGPRYHNGFRDPNVFRDDQTGLFHLIVATMQGNQGCLAQYTSPDLQAWTEVEPLLLEGHEVPECPDNFTWNGRHYLVYSNGGVARYRLGDTILGPWRKPAVETFDGPQARVIKTAAWNGNRRLATAFLAPQGYAGWAIFRELVQAPDGALGTRFVPEMMPATTAPAAPPEDIALADGAEVTKAVPRNAVLRFTLRAGGAVCGLKLRGTELTFDPGARHVTNAGATISGVEGLDGPVTVEVVVLDHLIDVCVGGRRTVVGWAPRGDGEAVTVFGRGGAARFEGFEARGIGQ
jgi:hypothetical protein